MFGVFLFFIHGISTMENNVHCSFIFDLILFRKELYPPEMIKKELIWKITPINGLNKGCVIVRLVNASLDILTKTCCNVCEWSHAAYNTLWLCLIIVSIIATADDRHIEIFHIFHQVIGLFYNASILNCQISIPYRTSNFCESKYVYKPFYFSS